VSQKAKKVANIKSPEVPGGREQDRERRSQGETLLTERVSEMDKTLTDAGELQDRDARAHVKEGFERRKGLTSLTR